MRGPDSMAGKGERITACLHTLAGRWDSTGNAMQMLCPHWPAGCLTGPPAADCSIAIGFGECPGRKTHEGPTQ